MKLRNSHCNTENTYIFLVYMYQKFMTNHWHVFSAPSFFRKFLSCNLIISMQTFEHFRKNIRKSWEDCRWINKFFSPEQNSNMGFWFFSEFAFLSPLKLKAVSIKNFIRWRRYLRVDTIFSFCIPIYHFFQFILQMTFLPWLPLHANWILYLKLTNS